MGMMGGGGGGMPAAGQEGGQPQAAAAKEAPKEVPKEKTHYDVELTEFDAAQKIKLIKEIRAILNLGLKEAKEMVESCPQWIKKELVKDEAEALKKKLEEIGAKVRLA
jgi:large subunit ribosomal protein L7/L12